MAFFGLKLGLDLEMRAAHPHQKFQGVPPPGAYRIDLVIARSIRRDLSLRFARKDLTLGY